MRITNAYLLYQHSGKTNNDVQRLNASTKLCYNDAMTITYWAVQR